LIQLSDGVDEGERVAVVLVDAGGDGEDVGVEDDVAGVEADLLGEEVVGAGEDLDLAVGGWPARPRRRP
jgi:hypothetical protein